MALPGMSEEKKQKYFSDRVNYWLKYFGLDGQYRVKVKFPETTPDDMHTFADCDLNAAEYRRVVISAYEALLNISTPHKYKPAADAVACHEVLHILLYPLCQYAQNMFYGDEGKRAEFLRLEEHTVTALQEVLVGPTPD